MSRTIAFCATGKTGLGHLRRIVNIARAVRERDAARRIGLLTNAAVDTLPPVETELFLRIEVVPRQSMANRLLAAYCGPVVVDTAVLPGLHAVAGPLCLILRETVRERLAEFRLEDGRAWDLLILPQPASEWCPDPDLVPARRVEAVGYVYRRPRVPYRQAASGAPASGPPQVLVASGAGGSVSTARTFAEEVGRLLVGLRKVMREPLAVVQALGPRGTDQACVPGADAISRPGADLHDAFAGADLVISTAGYNSVLELACTDVPVLLVPIMRTYDDQEKRARRWGERVGLCHHPLERERSIRWMSAILGERLRRRPVALKPSGAARCAALLAELEG
jgi:predicted glycosyltransferase